MADVDSEILEVLSAAELRRVAYDLMAEDGELSAQILDEMDFQVSDLSRPQPRDRVRTGAFPDYSRLEEPDLCQLAQFDSNGPPPWAIALSKQFKKDAAGLDRKLLGKAFEILAEITDLNLPFQPKGDTFKPLAGKMDGCWRYRLGDWRLVLRPNRATAQIVALALASRGSVYD